MGFVRNVAETFKSREAQAQSLRLQFIENALMRGAADLAEGDDVGEEGNDEQPRLAGQQEQDAPAQDQANQQINQNRQSKFH